METQNDEIAKHWAPMTVAVSESGDEFLFVLFDPKAQTIMTREQLIDLKQKIDYQLEVNKQ